MTDDTISRAAAIDTVKKHYRGYDNDLLEVIAYELERLPSAQPGWTTDVNDILAYLDGVVHPLVSPENWNVYSELHDMVSALPSAQPGWIPTSERTPEKSGNYLVTTPDGQVELRYYSTLYRWNGWVDMVAWMPLPLKWEGGQE